MSRVAGVGGILGILVVVMVFARLNGGETATVDLGVVTFRSVPITFILFGGLVLGMLVMLLAGLHADLKVRRLLRERLADEERDRPDRRDVVGPSAGDGAEGAASPTEEREPQEERPEDIAIPERD